MRGGRWCGAVEQDMQGGPSATECRTVMDKPETATLALASAPWKQQVEVAQCIMAM